MTTDPLRDLVASIGPTSIIGGVNPKPLYFVAAVLAVIDMRKQTEDSYDRDGYDRACGYNEALFDMRYVIAEKLGVEL